MNPYPDLLSDLGFASWVQRLTIDGHPTLFDSFCELNDDRAFPPCFIPVLERAGTGPHYFGVLKHSFVERTPVFVECSVENGYTLWEHARNEHQFAARLILSTVGYDHDEASDEFLALASDLGYANADELFRLFKEHEDGVYERLPLFVDDPPAGMHWMNGFTYKGEFPLEQFPFDTARAHEYSRIELDDETIQHSWPDIEPAAWQRRADQSRLFDTAFSEKRFADCWLIANSNGWKWADLRDAIDRLVSVSDDESFHKTMAAWQDSPHECWGDTF